VLLIAVIDVWVWLIIILLYLSDCLSMAEDPVDDFRSSLADLTFNSKPLINMLTMLAEENAQYAESIVRVIEEHIRQVKS